MKGRAADEMGCVVVEGGGVYQNRPSSQPTKSGKL